MEDNLLFALYRELDKNGIRIWNQTYSCQLVLTNRRIEEQEVIVDMLSPITVYSTDSNKQTLYYSPEQEEFYDAIKGNLFRKHMAYYGCEPDRFEIRPVTVYQEDKTELRYKHNYQVTAWKGIYKLQGSIQVLNMLYHTGLGSKNPEGYGMFEVYDM